LSSSSVNIDPPLEQPSPNGLFRKISGNSPRIAAFSSSRGVFQTIASKSTGYSVLTPSILIPRLLHHCPVSALTESCGFIGQQVRQNDVEGVQYANTSTAVAVVVPLWGGLLMVRHALLGGSCGKLALPGGYQMLGRAWQEARRRRCWKTRALWSALPYFES
jgi:hypothetical protein